jgi:hypothetical protein
VFVGTFFSMDKLHSVNVYVVSYDTPSVSIVATMSLQYPHNVSTVLMQYKLGLSLKFKVQIFSF